MTYASGVLPLDGSTLNSRDCRLAAASLGAVRTPALPEPAEGSPGRCFCQVLDELVGGVCGA
jgi:hypothetical protein